MARFSLPTTARLPSSLRVDPSNPSAIKLLNRLSRPSLLSLALDWLDENNQTICPPLLRRRRAGEDDNEEEAEEDDDEEEGFYPPARTLAHLRDIYTDMQNRKGSRREVVDRILEGDWRHGISLYQLAMADLQYLYEHPGTLKWSAYKIQRLKTPQDEDAIDNERGAMDRPDRETLHVPRFHPSTFLQNLQAEVLPDVKAHYNFDRPPGMPLLLLRVFVLDSPYDTDLALSNRTGRVPGAVGTHQRRAAVTSFDASRTIYVAFPDASPHIFLSKAQSSGATTVGETKSLRGLIVEGIPKALSRPRERYGLRATNLQTKNLEAMLAVKGGVARTNAAQAGWGIYAETKGGLTKNDNPLNAILLPTPPLSDGTEEEEAKRAGDARDGHLDSVETATKPKRTLTDPEEKELERGRKRSRVTAEARFGNSAKMDDGKGIERFDVVIQDPYPEPLAELPTNDRREGRRRDRGEARVDVNASPGQGQKRPSKGRKSILDISLRSEEQDDEGGGRSAADAHAASPQPGEQEARWIQNVRLAFHGQHVFGGIRQLVEAGVVDGEKMPGWMTGEEGVTAGAVRHGRIRGYKGSGL